MKKVLHIIDSLGVGGAEQLLINVVKNLNDLENHVICLNDENPLAAELPEDCRFVSLGFKKKSDSWKTIRFIRKYIKDHQIDVVHSHLVLSNILARLATPSDKVLINSLHNLNGVKIFGNKLSWQYWVEKLTYKKRHVLIAVSKTVLEDYNKYIGIKGDSHVLYNFVDERYFSPKPSEGTFNDVLRTVAVGSFKHQKNFSFLIKAFQTLPSNITLDIYGDGPLRSELEQLAAKTQGRVQLKGRVNNLFEIIPTYDLFIMPSLYEGHPVALLEVMAAGLPAIVSDIPVLREASRNNCLYWKLNDEADFKSMMMKILNKEYSLSDFARYNWELAREIGKKDSYISHLKSIYIKYIK